MSDAIPYPLADLLSLDGKTALVVGGSRNLGYDMAEALAEAGAAVAVSSRSAERAEEAAERLRRTTGAKTLAVVIDVTDEASIEAGLRKVTDEFTTFDVLVNNAGGGVPSASYLFEEREGEVFRKYLDINLTGAFLCSKHAARKMMERGSGVIINIASISGMVGRDRWVYEGSPGMIPNTTDYSSAKAGVIGMTRDMAAYLGPKGINVNCISPGGFERGQPPEFIKRYNKQTPLGRMGRDRRDLKAAVVFLASPGGDYVHGANIVVDGGFTCW
jgi:NAD(P)-dependent dehydrogenase (short-subunit alcohol dehydrogenase family)